MKPGVNGELYTQHLKAQASQLLCVLYSPNEYLLTSYYVLHAGLHAADIAGCKADRGPCPHGASGLVGETLNKQ